MDGNTFDLVLLSVLAVLGLWEGVIGVRERSRKRLIAAGAALIASGVLVYLHRDVIF